MSVLGKQIYRFDGVEVDASQWSLRRDGEELAVRHRAFQALLYLLEERHRLVTKEDLMNRVWKDQIVTDDALVQLIKELRRSLGDDPRQPRFIKTVPKVGYRFIAPVEAFIFDRPIAVEVKQQESIEIEIEETIIEDPPAYLEVKAGRAALLPYIVKTPRFGRVLGIVALILLIVGAIAIYFVARPRRTAALLAEVTLPQVPGKHPLAVLYFDNQSASQELDWLREGLADMLITGLSRSKDLTVLSRQQLQLLLERIDHKPSDRTSLEDALRVGQQSRAEVIILGSFAQLDGSIRINAQLQDARTGQSIASEQLVIDKPGDLFTQVDLLSLKIASRLGAASGDQQMKKELSEVMTGNLQAYRYYSLAMGKTLALQNSDALSLLERAIALDPQFAMAQARIGYVYVNWGMPEKARPYLEKAFRLSDRLTEKDRLLITAWYEIANRAYQDAIVTYRKIIAQYPLEVEAYLRLSHLLQGEDHFEDAIEVAKQGLAIDSEAKDLYNILGSVYSVAGQHEDAIRARTRYVELAPEEPNSHDSLGLSYQWAGRCDDAIEEYNRSLELKPNFEVAIIHLANTYFQLGRYREALKHYYRYIEVAPSDMERERGYSSIVYVYLKKGDLAQAEQIARKAHRFALLPLWTAMQIAIVQGDAAKAEKLKDQYFAKLNPYSERGARNNQRWFYQLRGSVALKIGHTEEAINHFKEVLKHRPAIWSIDPGEDSLANAYLELGKLDEAIAEYERVLRLNPAYPLASYHLAEAYERKGEAGKASEIYRKFLQFWEKADADIPEAITAKQRVSSE